jgi:hypothetical protein
LATSAPEKRSGRPSSHARGGQVRHLGGQGVELALAQLAGDFEDAVAFGQGAAELEFEEQVGGQQAGAGAGLDHVGRRQAHDLLHLAGQGLAEQGRELRCGDEVAAGAELVGAAAVVAEPGA